MLGIEGEEKDGQNYSFNRYYIIGAFLGALLSAIAITIDYSVVTDQSILDIRNPLIRCVESLTFSLQGSFVQSIIIFVAIFMLYMSLNKLKNTRRTYLVALSVSFLMAVVVIVGVSFAKTNSADLLYINGVQKLKTMILLFGYWGLFTAVTLWLFHIIDQCDPDKEGSVAKVVPFFKKHVFIISVGLIIICWLPRIISAYPGIFMGDTQYQLRQVYGDTPVSILHPIAHTVLFGVIVKPLQILTGSFNVAIYIYTLLQCGITIIVLAETIRRITDFFSKIVIPCIILAGYCFIPVFSAYALTLTKDSLWAPILAVWVMELLQLLSERGEYKRFAKFVLISLTVTLFRNNGIYVIVGTMIFLVFMMREHRKKVLITAFGIIAVWIGLNKFCVNVMGIQGGSSGEMLSVPFQQTARYVKEYSNEVTDEEKAAINKLLDYDLLAERYNPVTADPVKATFKNDCTNDDLKGYIKVWWEMFLKHPGLYVEAFINNTYGYFYFSQVPVIYSGKLSDVCIENTNKMSDVFDFSHYHADWMDTVRELFDKYFYFVGSIPLLGIFLTTAIWQWVMVFMTAYLILKDKKIYILAYVPLFILLLTNIAGPVNGSYYYRYEYPIAFCVPYMVFWTIVMCRKGIKGEEENTDEGSGDCASIQ